MSVSVTVILLVALCTDLRSCQIPNWLTFSAMAAGLTCYAWSNGVDGTLFSLSGLGTGLFLFLLLHVAGIIGAGDVKLMAAIGAWMGPYGALSSGILAMEVGGAYALAAMCYQWGVVPTGRRVVAAAREAVLSGKGVAVQELALPFRLRYGVAIAGGTFLTLAGLSPFMRWA